MKFYKNRYVSPSELSKDKIYQLKIESDEDLKIKNGKQYESKAIKSIGNRMADTMNICTSYLDNRELHKFSYLVRIDKDGNIIESTIFPIMALSNCFSGLMSGTKYPEHQYDDFLLHIQMRVKF